MNFNNRAFKYGDSLFETIKIIGGKIMLLDYHFERLKNSMEFLDFDIPDDFSEDYIETLIFKVLKNKRGNSRIRLSVFRDSEGFYIPASNKPKFYIEINELKNISYFQNNENYNLDIYDKLKVQKSPLSNLKTNNRLINIMAGLELKKNPILHNILLVNDSNDIVEAMNSNVFFIKENNIYTPKLSSGCINGVMRRFLLENLQNIDETTIKEGDLFDFDEMFLTNSIQGIIPIKNYRDKKLDIKKSSYLATFIIKKIDDYAKIQHF